MVTGVCVNLKHRTCYEKVVILHRLMKTSDQTEILKLNSRESSSHIEI